MVKRSVDEAFESDVRTPTPQRVVRRNLNPAKDFTSKPIQLVIGKEKTTFTVNRAVLTRHSIVLKKLLLDAQGKPNSRTKATFPDSNPEAFDIFLQFIHSGVICTGTAPSSSKAASAKSETAEWHQLCKARKEGKRLQSITFQDAVVDAIIEKMRAEGSTLSLEFYSTSSDSGGSKLKDLAIDAAVVNWSTEKLMRLAPAEIANEYLIALAIRLKGVAGDEKARASYDRDDYDGCHYHEHVAKGNRCWTTYFPDYVVPKTQSAEEEEGGDDEEEDEEHEDEKGDDEGKEKVEDTDNIDKNGSGGKEEQKSENTSEASKQDGEEQGN